MTITLNTVNGGSPPTGLTTSVTSSITGANCPCNVSGPLVPPGSDNFTFTSYDGSGNALATSTGTYTMTAGLANTGTAVTLLGIPKYFNAPIPPQVTPNSAYTTTYAFSVLDADNNAIVGTFASPITLSDNDSYGDLGVQLAVNGGTPASSVTVNASTDVVSYMYGGITDDPTLFLSASGVTTVNKQPPLAASNIAYSGPLNASNAPELDLYAPTGTGSQATFSMSELGWTNPPYDQVISSSLSGCGSIGTLSPASGTSFTFTAVASPQPGSCTITMSGGIGNTVTITATYTTNGFGVDARARR